MRSLGPGGIRSAALVYRKKSSRKFVSYDEHKQAARNTPVRAGVITVSDTRTEATDTSGRYIVESLSAAGVEIIESRIAPDVPERIESALNDLVARCEVIVTTGGTGIGRRDATIEVVTRKFERTLPGFGELFRMLSYEEIGAGAMLSRAVAGMWGNALVFSLPGSLHAVRLGIEQLILPEIHHLVWETIRQ